MTWEKELQDIGDQLISETPVPPGTSIKTIIAENPDHLVFVAHSLGVAGSVSVSKEAWADHREPAIRAAFSKLMEYVENGELQPVVEGQPAFDFGMVTSEGWQPKK